MECPVLFGIDAVGNARAFNIGIDNQFLKWISRFAMGVLSFIRQEFLLNGFEKLI
jgi:hypothetical protein